MARGGVNKTIVQKAREALLARGENPSIDAVRVELGNTGSKTTIHRYLKELEGAGTDLASSPQSLSEELTALVSRLQERLLGEGAEVIEQAQARFNQDKDTLEAKLAVSQLALETLQREFDIQRVALQSESAELQVCHSSLQAEQTRNARLSQNCADLELRIHDKDEHIRSLEEKHLHARDALEHYRNSVKDQREQEQRRHEGQVQQIQVELRQQQQMLSIKQEELTQLNRDNERLLGEMRQLGKVSSAQEDRLHGLNSEITTLKMALAKNEGARELLQEQVATLQQQSRVLTDAAHQASVETLEARRLLQDAETALERLTAEPAEDKA
ncbi:DNA-binding protein [Pseudomonas sp. NPDC090208]|uniref:DNA-binding protein n=1 Tax=Pseudomonas sp. NPDC090208 TaxID=3364478 RepID=UPI00381205B6